MSSGGENLFENDYFSNMQIIWKNALEFAKYLKQISGTELYGNQITRLEKVMRIQQSVLIIKRAFHLLELGFVLKILRKKNGREFNTAIDNITFY